MAITKIREPIISRMSIAGHPIHPMLIHFPVAALLGLIATDSAYIYTQDFFWARAGYWLLLTGVIGGAISSLIGLIDLLTVSRIRRLVTAWCHAIFAVTMLSVASLNYLLRIPDPAASIFPAGIYLSLLTAFLIFLTSIMGGQLVYEYGVGVEISQ
ncbi:DUF2231 domain-containing protein [Legionella jamestowniensis]|uniref:DUF2231 domain-containing protein n=1 Tax=Legionella jamestowniensis TaxID=455 RepID=A0A0W0V050_9GAMM|nr:DUF2231 domain-containing protein [Legionella jamestowniensis]KTD13238.1 hypothetical protein Ljam_0028 [Legionella jamestowniensis]OCH98271.1 hypothetical protein A8135_11985 [Legionella jamestowniensis]SFL78252.1 Uncharacterized membrane protein [Legionella jamestowniensis DSM 19215]